MGLFDKIKEPIFLKEDSSAKKQAEQLQNLLAYATTEELKEQIKQDIKIIKYGIAGEDKIAFELKNSHMPMFILQDLYLEYENFSAQIDYLIITRKRCFVVECKNLYGNIEINSNGDFIRTIYYKNKFKKEGIYSPITQNKRHIELIKLIRSEQRSNIITKALFEKFFYDKYKSVVVLANPKTFLNDKNAKTDIKSQVIRADQLIEYIRMVNSESDAIAYNEKYMEEVAQFFLSQHKQNAVNYVDKYENLVTSKKAECTPTDENENNSKEIKLETQLICPRCGAPMIKRIASKGNNVGKEFWGCSKFPKCRSIVNIQ